VKTSPALLCSTLVPGSGKSIFCPEGGEAQEGTSGMLARKRLGRDVKKESEDEDELFEEVVEVVEEDGPDWMVTRRCCVSMAGEM